MPRAPKKINSFVCIDFETGGLKHEKNPVTEFAGLAINGVTLQEIIRYDNIVKPYDNSLVYEPAATKIHGLSKERCEKEGVRLSQIVSDACVLFEEANLYNTKTAKPILVAHNPGFDVPFLQDIFKRAKVDLSKYIAGYFDIHGHFQPEALDTTIMSKQCWGEVTDLDTKFNLKACCEKAGVDFVDAHRAMTDVVATTDLFRYLITRMRSSGGQVIIDEGGQIETHRQTFEW